MLFSVTANLHFEIKRNINRVQIFQDHEFVDCIKQGIKRIGTPFPSFCYLNEKLISKKNLLYQRRRTNQQWRFSHHLSQSINHTNFSHMIWYINSEPSCSDKPIKHYFFHQQYNLFSWECINLTNHETSNKVKRIIYVF